MKACFMGLGYIGLPTAIIAAGSGIQVIGVDVNPKVVEMTKPRYYPYCGTWITGVVFESHGIR